MRAEHYTSLFEAAGIAVKHVWETRYEPVDEIPNPTNIGFVELINSVNALVNGYLIYTDAGIFEVRHGLSSMMVSLIDEFDGEIKITYLLNATVNNLDRHQVIIKLRECKDNAISAHDTLDVLFPMSELIGIPEDHVLLSETDLYDDVIYPSNFQEGFEIWVNDGPGSKIMNPEKYILAMRLWCQERNLSISKKKENS